MNAGTQNILLRVCQLSNASYLTQPEPTPWLGKALVAFFLGGAVATICGVAGWVM